VCEKGARSRIVSAGDGGKRLLEALASDVVFCRRSRVTFHAGGQRLAAVVLVSAVAASLACSAATQRGTGAPSGSVLLADEIRSVRASNAYEAVSRLRPEWLRRRGVVTIRDPNAGEVVVYLDGIRFGGPRSLANIRVQNVIQIQYVDPSDAAVRFGTDHLGGAILVRTR
jgi:hypothetical protein